MSRQLVVAISHHLGRAYAASRERAPDAIVFRSKIRHIHGAADARLVVYARLRCLLDLGHLATPLFELLEQLEVVHLA